MDSSNASAADRRSAHRRVGATATAAFLALLLLAVMRGPAAANPTVPAPAPTGQSSEPAPAQPRETAPFDRGRDGDHDGFRGRGGPDFGGGGGDAPAAPGTGGNTT
jgi:hypothetical protein